MILLTLFSSIIGFSNEQLLLLHLFQHDMDMTGSMHDMFDSGSGTSDDMNMSNIIYDKRVRPVRNFEDVVNTTFSLKLNSLDYFKQPEEKIRFNVELDLYWKDQFLTWEPSNFNGVTSLNVDPNEIWTPDIELYNSGGYPELWTKNSESTVDYMGNVFLSIPMLITFSCFLELEEFPFDTQVCSMEFGSWKFNKRYLDIRVINETLTKHPIINYDNFYHNEWNIISTNGVTDDIEYLCCPGDYFPTSTLSIELQRKYTKYNIVIIMTIFLTISSLNVLLLSMEKYRRTFILVFIPLTIIWVQLYVASQIPVIRYSTKMEELLMVCYYICMLCAIYSGLFFCILNNELKILEKFGVRSNIKRNYKIKPHNTDVIYFYKEHEIVGKKYLDFRKKIKILDNLIKSILTICFFFSILGILVR
jgi:nicotinic acetylcholine receptor, invertebrate